jgi:dTDP-4-amino-4,6-dideoxygalactose transaminase
MKTIRFVDLRAQYESIRADIDTAIRSTLDSCQFVGGPVLARFEEEFAAYQGARHCIGVANGTDAIEIVFEALDLPRGGEVIVPANSFIASSEAVSRIGLKPVFCAADQATYLIDLTDARAHTTPRTCAVLPVHLYGQPCDMDAVMAFASEFKLKVVEDSAQAHGAEWKGRRVGTFGVAATFSFYPGKNLGAYGDGGAIVTNDDALHRRMRMIANHGRIEKYNHEFEGRNSRLDALQAGILSAKLKHLERWIDARQEIARIYLRELADVDGLELPAWQNEARHVFHLFVIRTAKRDALQAHLKARGIETGIHYPIALPKLQAYRQTNQATASDEDGEKLLSLPIGEHMSDIDVGYVVSQVRDFFTGTRISG